jgi:transcriptional regulator with XRE-family HTH domain
VNVSNGSLLRRLRLARDLTIEQVGQAVGLSAPGYHQIEVGIRRANAYAAKRIADFFELPIEELFVPATYSVRVLEAE